MEDPKELYGHWSTAELALKSARKEVEGLRRILWVMAKANGGTLMVHRASLDRVPDEAELLTWSDVPTDSLMIKAMDPSTQVITKESGGSNG